MATAAATHIPETIRLQLRKPRSWQWELSTSKSSPNLILPVIQLYDCKGQLLVEAKDSANITRKIWSSTLNPCNQNSDNRTRKIRSRSINTSRSDTSNSIIKKSSSAINLPDKKEQTQRYNSPNFVDHLDDSKDSIGKTVKRSISSNLIQKIAIKEAGRRQVYNGLGLEKNRLEKSKSEFYDHSGHLSLSKNGGMVEGKIRHRRSKSDDLFRRKLRYNSSEESLKRAEMDGYRNFITPNIPDNEIQAPGEKPQTYNSNKNRKGSRNKMMCSVENVTLDGNKRNIELEELRHDLRYTTRTSSAGTLIIPEESFKEPEGNVCRRRRNRRLRDGSVPARMALNSLTEGLDVESNTKNDFKYPYVERVAKAEKRSDPTALLTREKLEKYAASPASVADRHEPGSKKAESANDNREYQEKEEHNLVSSHTGISTFNKKNDREHVPIYQQNQDDKFNKKRATSEKLENDKCEKSKIDYYQTKIENFRNKNVDYRLKLKMCREKLNNYRNKNRDCRENDVYRYNRENYEKIISDLRDIAENSYIHKNFEYNEPVTKNSNRSRQRLRRSRTVDDRSSSSSMERTKFNRKGHLIKEHSATQREKEAGAQSSAGATLETGTGGSGDANDLLNLVRRLSYSYIAPKKPATLCDEDDHQQVDETNVKMGANVSRHSAKGLGRRSQSSGSICNGSGSGSGGKGSRHPEGKICSSLPSYLDEREKNGAYNNNHGRKYPIDEDRIPPLGDSAPLHWKFSETQTICDQGYGSERSPEEEYPPPLTSLDQETLCHHHLEPHACYPFITPESTFVVKLNKGSRGLGLSVTGGIDSTGSWPGLIRIKRLFPHQPASSCGLLNVGDLILEANGITLTGLTNYEALEVLRTAPNHVDLRVCRPPPDVLNCVSPISEVPPPPPRREPPNTLNLPSNAYTTPEDECYHGEFEITLKKTQGSLGFTLRKEDDSALGHYVRALVREPALTDGRIRAGDKIIAVNDVELCPMTHEQAVQFLRQCPEIVKLRLYRDSAQTPVATLSPTETTPRTSFSRKAHLRQEAVDMLNDLAGRKLSGMNPEIYNRSLSPTSSSPRRLRRQPCPSDASQGEYIQAEYIPREEYINPGDQPSQSVDYDYQEQFHEGIIQKCPRPFDEDAFNSLFSMELDDGDRPNRPSSLELYNPNQTPVASRKPRFNFSLAHNAYELNNLDAEVLDAPNLKYNLCNEDVKTSDSEVQEPVSMPPIPTVSNFIHKHPAYQSAHPQINSEHELIQPAKSVSNNVDDGTLKRRKNTIPQQCIENKEVKRNVIQQRPIKEEYEVLAIELNRGWNSRLGFSLQGAAGVTYVSAVHADSVAARDGRLKPGDRLIKVNDESIEHMTTSEIIDLLRIVRGPVCIVISRVKSNEDCPKSNAEN